MSNNARRKLGLLSLPGFDTCKARQTVARCRRIFACMETLTANLIHAFFSPNLAVINRKAVYAAHFSVGAAPRAWRA